MSNSCGGGSVLEGGGVVAVGMMRSVRVCSGAGGGDGRFQPFEIHPVLCVILFGINDHIKYPLYSLPFQTLKSALSLIACLVDGWI